MASTKKREDLVNDLVLKEGNTIVTDSLIVADMYKEDQNSVISTIINQIQNLNEIEKGEFFVGEFIKSVYAIKGIDSPTFKLIENTFAYRKMGDINVNTLVEYCSNTFVNLNTESCLQQRLNKMIRLLALSKNISFQKAWRVFRSMYNKTYRTNLKLKMYHYKKKNKLKRLTAPQYLAIQNKLENAIRVADTLLNKKNMTA
ncbi:Rha family transcriptional regulator [Bacillus toyonensis]|uniref:Rha family transcriptional regulator n=1 Tax=Bacillus toyonensis TaxID=155322 RepID=UPI00163A6B08|nr:Rha family transcriptional regulator [Bacillus toyonensis]MBC2686447.1 Rha family transcriptional regulator [Bacillus toyonensis]